MSKNLKGHFLSDLHLFARRSTAPTITPLIRDAASRSHTMVLGGDIFDFKWSMLPTLESSIDAAISWLTELIEANEQCSFHYLLGNHDAHPRFVFELDRLSTRQPRIRWQPFVLRMENRVFLHGDIVDGMPTVSDLVARRKRHESLRAPRKVAHWLYELAVHARLHRATMHIAIRQNRVLRKLAQYLSDENLDAKSGVQDVYFGHTHRMVEGAHYRGLTFHNGGAAIKGLPFRIIETQ